MTTCSHCGASVDFPKEQKELLDAIASLGNISPSGDRKLEIDIFYRCGGNISFQLMNVQAFDIGDGREFRFTLPRIADAIYHQEIDIKIHPWIIR